MMKRSPFRMAPLVTIMLAVAFLMLSQMPTAQAAKPSKPDNNVIGRSNGYPSGPHFNLNIHGKKDDFTCDSSPGGKSVFVREYGKSTLQYVSNKKSSVTDLIALDPCAEQFDGDPAKVQIPTENQGYYVFARLRAKPQNGNNSDDDATSIILTPNPILELCNESTDSIDFGDATSCSDDLLSLGLVTNDGVYKTTDEYFERWDSTTGGKGKGKAKATDITGLFTWTGYSCDDVLDINGDGVIDVNDVPVDLDGDGDIDDVDLGIFLSLNCTFYNQEWIFNIADLVVQDQDINNNGSKLLKLRFYPVATTEYMTDTPDVAAEIHDSSDVNHANVGGSTVQTGTTVHASAALTAGTGPTPTGTVTFQRFDTIDCSGVSVDETLTLVNGTMESGDHLTTAGYLSYLVAYNPDAASDHYNPSSSACVPLAVGTTPSVATQIHDGLHTNITGGSIVAGNMVHAQASVSGAPTGTMTFQRFASDDCSGASVNENVALDLAGNAESSVFVTVLGAMSYVASYNGEDANYFPASGACVALTVTSS